MIKYYGFVLSKLIEKYHINNQVVAPDGTEYRRVFDAVFIDALKTELGYTALLALLFCAVFAYLIGSLNFAVIISKLFFKDDVRLHGSGNAGATNMLRTYGNAAGIATFVCDALKGAVSVLLSMLILGEGGAYVGGLFCILGHIFPVFYKFRGGKGVVVSAVTILCLEPLAFLFLLVLFVLIVGMSKYISLGSVICAFFFPLIQNAFSQADGFISFISTTISVLIAVIVIVMHKENIKRLMNRTENKLSFKKKGA